MPRRGRNGGAGNNSNGSPPSPKRGREVFLHGLNCDDINEITKGMDHAEKREIVNKIQMGETALHLAIDIKDSATVKCLLELGAIPNVRGRRTIFTPLHDAVNNDDIATVKVLLEGGADPIEPTGYGGSAFTPLYTASEKGFTGIVELLLGYRSVKSSINNSVSDEAKFATPLYIAIIQGRKDIVRLLEQNGADLKGERKNNMNKDGFQEELSRFTYSGVYPVVRTFLIEFEYVKDKLGVDIDGDLDVNKIINRESLLSNALVNISDGNKDEKDKIIEFLLSKGARLADGEYEEIEHEIPEKYKDFLRPVETPPGSPSYRKIKTRRGKSRSNRKTRRVKSI
jgi:ankyrin repeat protein